jgi:hypothetical protein
MHYSVSDTGLVRNDETGEILKPFACGFENAYLCVDLYNGSRGSRKRFKIHRLVAKAFIPRGYGPDASRRNEVNHMDTDPHNNGKDNLEWCDRLENENHKRFMNAHKAFEEDLDEEIG